jgi:hypothetical protein
MVETSVGMNAELMRDYGVRDVVLYVARRLRCFHRIDKLMSIIFLAQYDVNAERRVVCEYRCGGRPLARAEFYIWSHGPMSNEVYDVLESGDFDLVSGELGLELCYAGPAPRLPKPVAARLSDATARYGGWRPWQLARHVNQLLGLDVPERKSDYIGHRLHTYLRAEGFALVTCEVCVRDTGKEFIRAT